MRLGHTWGEGKRQRTGNLSAANSWKRGEYWDYPEAVLLQTSLVLNFFLSPAVGPIKYGTVGLA